MILNFVIAITVSRLTAKPPQSVQELVDNIRIPSGTKATANH
jgi:cation/acetate symporter